MLNRSPLHAVGNDGYDSTGRVYTTHMKITECIPILTVKTHRFEYSGAQPYEFMKPPAGVACQKVGSVSQNHIRIVGSPGWKFCTLTYLFSTTLNPAALLTTQYIVPVENYIQEKSRPGRQHVRMARVETQVLIRSAAGAVAGPAYFATSSLSSLIALHAA